jgi:uncharacterized protein
VAQIGQERGAEWRSLDRAATRQVAEYDRTEFVAGADCMIIDEVQRVPDLLPAIKETVHPDPRPDRFLLTGSARVPGGRACRCRLRARRRTGPHL